MADLQPGVWGIDIGQCALKAVRLEVVDDQVTATAFDYVEHSKILSQPDAEPDQLTREALEKFLSRNEIRGDVVAISVPGQSGLARFVKLPPVEEKKIPDIVRFEAKQQIPFPLDEVVWDFQKIGSGNVTDGFAMETEIGLFAIKRDMVNRAMQQFQDVDVEVHIIQMAPLALTNFLAFDLLGKGGPAKDDEDAEEKTSEKQCVVGLDIGTDNSNLVITDGERIIWQRPIPFGGNHFTRALTKDLKLTFAKAEHLKRNATKSPDLKKILTSLKPVLNDFVNEVQRSLGYFTNTHRNAQVAYMVGLGNAFRLPGLQKFLSEKLQLEVRKLQKMERLHGETVTTAPAFTQNILSFATAYGLAVQGFKLGRLSTNLLPKDIQFERMVRAKKPWALAGAAALFLGLLGPTVYYGLQYRAVAADAIANEIDKQDKPLVSRINSANAEFTKREAEVKKQEDAVRNIIAGQEERLNWILLNEFIDACMPVPGLRVEGTLTNAQGQRYEITDRQKKQHAFNVTNTTILKGNAPADPRELKPDDQVAVIYNDQLNGEAQKYWNAAARGAYLQLIERQAAGRKTGDKGEGEGVENLIQVNVESIYPLFCNDLKGYFEQLRKDMKDKDLPRMLSKARNEKIETGPEGKGWVVELRGYTYFRPGQVREFLLDTLHYNLSTKAALLDRLAKKEAAPTADKTPAAGPGTKGTAAPAAPNPDKGKNGEEAAPVLTPEEEKAQKWHTVINIEEAAGGKEPGYRISYVVLYDYKTSDDTTGFQLISGSAAATLVASAASAQPAAGDVGGGGTVSRGGGERGAARAPTPVTSDTPGGGAGRTVGPWQPLIDMSLGGAAGDSVAAPGRRIQTSPPAAPPGERTSGTPGTPPAETAAKAAPKRTEFVMLFVWKEPTPSDAITGTESGAASVAAPAGGRKGSGKSSRGAPPVTGAPPVD